MVSSAGSPRLGALSVCSFFDNWLISSTRRRAPIGVLRENVTPTSRPQSQGGTGGAVNHFGKIP
jgi:hypothetical protein